MNTDASQPVSNVVHDVVDKPPTPHVDELGATSAPLKSAAFFLGSYCKEYNGAPDSWLQERFR
jgi:hypothetical protein